MGKPFNFRPRQTCVLVATFCLSVGNAYAVACPAASGGQILVDNVTVTATCTVSPLQNIQVTSTGSISTSYPNPSILIAAGTEIGAVYNAGTVQSSGNALQVQGTMDSDINNYGIFAGTGVTGGQVSEGMRLDGATVVGGIINNSGASITAANGNAIHLVASELDGGLRNYVNGEIHAAGGYAAILLEGGTRVYNGIVNEGHIGPSAVGPQNGRGLQIVGSIVYGNYDANVPGSNAGLVNSGTIDARGAGAAVQLDNSTAYAADNASGALGTLTNSGTIDASNAEIGIELINGSRIGTVENSAPGVINAAYYGIGVSQSTVSGGIVNAGVMNAMHSVHLDTGAVIGAGGVVNDTGAAMHGERGIAAYGAQISGDIVNRGLIDGTEGGITLENNASVSGSVSNHGTITALRDAILLNLSLVYGDITNHGSIAVSDGFAVEVLNGSLAGTVINDTNATISGLQAIGPDAGAIQVNSSTVSNGIGNAGTLSGRNGIVVANGSTVGTGGIVNGPGGVIQATNVGITVADSIVQGAINNGGRITGGAAGVAVSGASTLGGGIVNSGTISAVDALLLTNTGAAFVVSNSGALDGNVQLGRNRLDLLGAGTVSGNVVGSAGSIVNIGTDAAHTASVTPTGNFSGLDQFNIGEGSTLRSRNGMTVGAATVTNAGVLSIAAGQAVNVVGDYTQAAGGVLRTGINSASSFGKLNVSGNASLASGTGIDVDVGNAAMLAIGTVAAGVVAAGGTLKGAATAAVTDNSYLFNFKATSADGKTLDLTTVSAAPSAPAPAPDPAPAPAPAPRSATTATLATGNTAGFGAAQVFDGLIVNGATGDMVNVITALGKLPTAQSVSDAVAQTLPLATGATTTATQGAMAQSDSAVRDRLDVVQTGGPDGDDSAKAPDRGIWFMPFGAWTRQQGRDGVDGYRAQSGGMVLGADTAVSARDRVGGAFGYSRAGIDGKGAASQSAHIDVYRLMAYGRHDIDDSTFVHWQGDVGSTQTSGHRAIAFGGLSRKAEADYSGTVAHVGGDIGRVFLVNSATQFTPSLRADYAMVRNSAYTETGAGALNLQVQGQKTEQFLLSAHGKLTQALAEGLQLSSNVGLGYDFLAKRNRVVSTFVGGGATFATEGLGAQRFVAYGGLGLTLLKAKGLELSARYDVELRRAFSNQSISFKLAKKF
jgi:uncharacterized protein with beta-barrel porin domain